MDQIKNENKITKKSKNIDKNEPSIIIIGAGASGIAAAAKLCENNFQNVKILEAENRIGGRIHTTKFCNQTLELGAHWIVGEHGNVICDLAKKYNLFDAGTGTIDDSEEKIFNSSGNLISLNPTELEKLSEIYDIEGNFKEFCLENKNSSVGDFYNGKIHQFLEEHPKWKANKKGITHLLDMMMMALYSGDSWNDSSVMNNINYEECPGEYIFNWRERGFISIIDILMRRYPKIDEQLPVMSNIHLKTKVSLIDYSRKNGKIIVKTTNNECYTADHVIFTCSVGVLKKQHNTLFKPPLSDLKQKAIQEMGYGTLVKIYLYYDEPWWNVSESIGHSFLWSDNDLELMESDGKNWLPGLVGFYSFRDKPKIISGWVFGKYARIVESCSDEEVKNHCFQILGKFLGKSYNVTYPTSILRSNWYSNENFNGTFCYFKMNSDHGIGNAENLGEPIVNDDDKPIILFAGEATSEHHLTTVHGAIETGWREAQRIIDYYS
ncbi:spermine oxidase-like [Leptopilina heterotoma]|uniref:spermine oxidase-like n=1 Tax=Leptopilina heterotoma TaxID=63436 RepID=UPI001CA879A0|nr:spermine oxidase-like [Leptopilina heterotoma]